MPAVIQSGVPVCELNPVKEIVPLEVIPVAPVIAPPEERLNVADAIDTESKAEPIAMVSAFVSSVPILIALPEVPVPKLTAPVVPESKVRALVVFDLIVNAPESTMLLVVKVCEPITVPVMNVPTPVLLIRVVPPSVNAPAVIATFPVVAVMPAEPVNRPAEVIVPDPVVEMLPEVASVPAEVTVSWPVDPTVNKAVAFVVPIPTLP